MSIDFRLQSRTYHEHMHIYDATTFASIYLFHRLWNDKQAILPAEKCSRRRIEKEKKIKINL